ncbi:MAG: hypothetical protein ACLFV2_05110 [Desulfurivibrionaceae bacterium]
MANLTGNRQHLLLLLIISVFLLSGPVSCAVKPERDALRSRVTAYVPSADRGEAFHRFAPVFVAEGSGEPHNRIGTPSAGYSGDREEIHVDPSLPTVYVRRQHFSSGSDDYTNLIYRIHFPEVPCSIVSFHLTCGDNGGLLIYITLDEEDSPVLITTVHTCGCYLAFVPTNHLAKRSYPDNWDKDGQKVYGEVLPGGIVYSSSPENSEERLVVRLRRDTHRVRDVAVADPEEIRKAYRVETYRQLPAEDLLNIPLNGGHTSFFEEEGCRKGYVKESKKPYERLLMSWWTFDWHIGEDKRLGPPEKTGVVFYTSLKFWAREESNIWYFDRFLDYWGWQL